LFQKLIDIASICPMSKNRPKNLSRSLKDQNQRNPISINFFVSRKWKTEPILEKQKPTLEKPKPNPTKAIRFENPPYPRK